MDPMGYVSKNSCKVIQKKNTIFEPGALVFLQGDLTNDTFHGAWHMAFILFPSDKAAESEAIGAWDEPVEILQVRDP